MSPEMAPARCEREPRLPIVCLHTQLVNRHNFCGALFPYRYDPVARSIQRKSSTITSADYFRSNKETRLLRRRGHECGDSYNITPIVSSSENAILFTDGLFDCISVLVYGERNGVRSAFLTHHNPSEMMDNPDQEREFSDAFRRRIREFLSTVHPDTVTAGIIGGCLQTFSIYGTIRDATPYRTNVLLIHDLISEECDKKQCTSSVSVMVAPTDQHEINKEDIQKISAANRLLKSVADRITVMSTTFRFRHDPMAIAHQQSIVYDVANHRADVFRFSATASAHDEILPSQSLQEYIETLPG